MLLAVAILPLAAESWFERNRNKAHRGRGAGRAHGHLPGRGLRPAGPRPDRLTPPRNTSPSSSCSSPSTPSPAASTSPATWSPPPDTTSAFLAAGAVLASFIGTMGASMVLIRPLLRANSERTHVRHTVIFFIFAVSNVGGLLTPLGRPPALPGLSCAECPSAGPCGLWPQWLLVVGLVLAVYLALEYLLLPQGARGRPAHGPRRLRAHAAQGRHQHRPARPGHRHGALLRTARAGWARPSHFPFVREVILVVLAVISLQARAPGPASLQPLQLGAR